MSNEEYRNSKKFRSIRKNNTSKGNETRRVLDIKEGDPIEIWSENNSVVLNKYRSKDECLACGSTENVVVADGISICKKCASKVIEIFR